MSEQEQQSVLLIISLITLSIVEFNELLRESIECEKAIDYKIPWRGGSAKLGQFEVVEAKWVMGSD